MNARLRQRGFSLVELMIGMALALVITAVIVAVFQRANTTSRVTQTMNEVQEQARVALDMLQRDVRGAGYIGCNSNRLVNSGGLINNIDLPNAYRNSLNEYVMGHDGTGALFSPAASAGLIGASPNPETASDAITVRVPVGDPVSLSGAMGTGTATIPVFSTVNFVVGNRAIVADCAGASAFYVTGTAGGIQHGASAGTNASADLGRAYGPDAMVVPFNTITYYVGLNGDADNSRSLYRRVEGAAASEEVAEDIEDFQVQYGVDTNNDNFADTFLDASAVVDWQRVVSVRASILVRSRLAQAAISSQDYDFNGQTAVMPADHRMRRPFNVTIQLRNRTL